MEKKFRITVEGKQYIVAVEDITTGGTQGIYPEPGSMNIAPQPAAPVPTAPAPAASASPAAAAGPGGGGGPRGRVGETGPPNRRHGGNEGGKLISLEAMKMVTHVVARRGGKVTSIAVKPGDPVDAGQVLLSIG